MASRSDVSDAEAAAMVAVAVMVTPPVKKLVVKPPMRVVIVCPSETIVVGMPPSTVVTNVPPVTYVVKIGEDVDISEIVCACVSSGELLAEFSGEIESICVGDEKDAVVVCPSLPTVIGSDGDELVVA